MCKLIVINTSWIRESFMKLGTLNIWPSLHFIIIKTYYCKIKRIKICVCLVGFVALKKIKKYITGIDYF